MTTTTPATDTTPRAWIGCLSCYNEGRLVGDWFNAEIADEVTTYDVHGAHSRADAHDELWVFDHENIPVRGELDPLTAAAWGRCLTEVDEHLRPALCAGVESGDYVAEGTGAGLWNFVHAAAKGSRSNTAGTGCVSVRG